MGSSGIRNCASKSKKKLISDIIDSYNQEETYDDISIVDSNNNNNKRRSKHCPFRLLNILFSDDYAADFARLGDAAPRNSRGFWMQVAEVFASPSELHYGMICFKDDHRLVNCGINPSHIQRHDWQKLRDMWKIINRGYKEAEVNFTKSGTTHESDFW